MKSVLIIIVSVAAITVTFVTSAYADDQTYPRPLNSEAHPLGGGHDDYSGAADGAFKSEGKTYRRYGNTTYDDEGNSWSTYGPTTYGSDGSECSTYGTITRCR